MHLSILPKMTHLGSQQNKNNKSLMCSIQQLTLPPFHLEHACIEMSKIKFSKNQINLQDSGCHIELLTSGNFEHTQVQSYLGPKYFLH